MTIPPLFSRKADVCESSYTMKSTESANPANIHNILIIQTIFHKNGHKAKETLIIKGYGEEGIV